MTADIRELLKFYAEAGVDEAIEENPIDRFAEFAAQRPQAAAQAPAVEAGLRQAGLHSRGIAAAHRAAKPFGHGGQGPATSGAADSSVPDEGQVLLARELAAAPARSTSCARRWRASTAAT